MTLLENQSIAYARSRVQSWLFPFDQFFGFYTVFLGMAPGTVKNYQVNDLVVNRVFELKHGKAVRAWPMDKVSDSPFTQVCPSRPGTILQHLIFPAEGV